MKPSCLHTTAALYPVHKSSHTVPHLPCRHTSTRPLYWLSPPTNRTYPVSHAEGSRVGQITPASSRWAQLGLSLYWHDSTLGSSPEQTNSLAKTGPSPCPKKAPRTLTAPGWGGRGREREGSRGTCPHVHEVPLLHTFRWESQLPTDHHSVLVIPAVRTYRAPCVTEAELHRAFVDLLTSRQCDVAFRTSWPWKESGREVS